MKATERKNLYVDDIPFFSKLQIKKEINKTSLITSLKV
jgi:hypothetical protein